MDDELQADFIEVRDLGLAASLVSLSLPVVSVTWKNNRAYFNFANTDKAQEATLGYWSDTLQVKARSYFEATKMLKGRIYGERGL